MTALPAGLLFQRTVEATAVTRSLRVCPICKSRQVGPFQVCQSHQVRPIRQVARPQNAVVPSSFAAERQLKAAISQNAGLA